MSQKIRFLIGLAALVLLATSGCRSARTLGRDFGPGAYYTRYSLFVERDVYRTTNYRRGTLLPINTQVTLVSNRRDSITVLAVGTGRRFVVEHMPKHTNDSLEVAFDKVFSATPTDLTKFSTAEQEAIRRGDAIVGMDRTAVLAAMGPPPASGTSSLDLREWRYWDTRMTTFVVRFDDKGRVVDAGR